MTCTFRAVSAPIFSMETATISSDTGSYVIFTSASLGGGISHCTGSAPHVPGPRSH